MKTYQKILLSFFISFNICFAQGKVYLVLGSDTAIWDGLTVGKYNCSYNLSLYSDPSKNGYRVMDPVFRNQFKDSYGETLKLTWWMMAGNVFLNAVNKNIPVPNTMTLYSMKKWEGERLRQFGDELSLHYHTYWWTDYDGDGVYWWNQARSFDECREDFDVALAQFLIEENTFPVSFRTGWHAMDNSWQNYIDKLIPYSMHNDYPGKRTDTVEPLDNLFDWSRCSPEFVPFHPSLSDYQLAGNGKSWNVRSINMASIKQAQMDTIFAKAKRGIDQVACIWAHLPESDFLDNIKRVDSLAHISAAKFPSVKFDYCTAVEAMQKWRKGNDTIPPLLNIAEEKSGNGSYYTISSSEPVFQTKPFVAVKDINENYFLLNCAQSGTNMWRTVSPVQTSGIVKLGAAVCDTMGNLATKFINYLPDEIFLDNKDVGYSEKSGNWITSSDNAWGTDSRQCNLGTSDSVQTVWTAGIAQTGVYNIYFQVPKLTNIAGRLTFDIYSGSLLVKSANLAEINIAKDWIYIASAELKGGTDVRIEMKARAEGQISKTVYADVVRISSLVKEKAVFTLQKNITLGDVSEEDSVRVPLILENRGIKTLTVSSLRSKNGLVSVPAAFPIFIPGMSKITIPLSFYSIKRGECQDSLIVRTDDPWNSELKLYFSANVKPYFVIADNNDTQRYKEKGSWNYSNAGGWAASSRWAQISQGAYAIFTVNLAKTGTYEVSEFIPATVNAAKSAAYIITAGGKLADTVIIDQNINSGSFVNLGKYKFETGIPVDV